LQLIQSGEQAAIEKVNAMVPRQTSPDGKLAIFILAPLRFYFGSKTTIFSMNAGVRLS
jgi:hypothetical protein